MIYSESWNFNVKLNEHINLIRHLSTSLCKLKTDFHCACCVGVALDGLLADDKNNFSNVDVHVLWLLLKNHEFQWIKFFERHFKNWESNVKYVLW